MLKLKKYQQYVFGLFATLTLLFLGASILAISLFSANRQQSTNIKQVSTEIINLYTQPEK